MEEVVVAFEGTGGTLTQVSASNPLPTSATGTASITGTVVGEGTAGTPVGGLITVQGQSGMTALAVGSATGAAVPAAADYIGFSNAGGTLVGVSATNPLPVTLESEVGTLSVQGTVSLGAGTAKIGTVSPATTTPTAATATSITTGGTATALATGPWQGGFIQNPLSAGDQNIATAETLYINLVTTATANGRGSNVALYPGDSFDLPSVSAGVTLSAIAATTGHAVSIELFV